ncbi:MAG: Flp family type IVb pilin [Anaerolineaceae bacterium]|nr:Flp family type IVb pilin [Anaerolineaceae bacterium]
MWTQYVASWLDAHYPVRSLNRFDAKGQGLVEYAFILVMVAVVVIIILAVVGLAVKDGLYENIIENI